MIKIKKICSFYVSDWHMITMLLPHVNKAINNKTKITTILEDDYKDKITMLLSKLRLKNERQINRINWNKTINIENKSKEILKNATNDEINIIVAGDSDYIDKANNEIERYLLTKSTNSNLKITIINCYNVEEIDVKEILNKHEGILNTSGEKSKQEFLKSLKIQ